MLRRWRIPLLVIAGSCTVVFTALVVLAKVYGPTVEKHLVAAINQRLLVPVSVARVDLTLIARFPKASLRLSDVLVPELRTDGHAADTLLHAREIHLEFGLWQLFRGNYTVDHIHGEQVRLYPAIDTRGNPTHLVWKTDSTGQGSDISLENMDLAGATVRFRDHRDDLEVLLASKWLGLFGRFSDAGNQLTLRGDAHLMHWRTGETTLLADRRAQVRLPISFGGTDDVLRIRQGEVAIGKLVLETELELKPSAKGRHLDLRANALGAPLADALALLPEDMAKPMQRYTVRGDADLALRYSGPLDGEGPALSVGAKVAAARLKESRSGSELRDMRGELALELSPQGTPRKLEITGFHARSGSGTLSGDWRSNGLKNATIDADLKGDIALADLLRLLQVDTLEQVGGHLRANARIEGRLRDISDLKAADLRQLRISGNASLRDATLKLKGLRHRVEQLDADMAIQGNHATVDGLKASVQGSTVALRGTLKDLLPFLLFDDHRLLIEAEATSPRIDLAEWLKDDNPKGGRGEATPYTLTLPGLLELDLRMAVEELVFEDFSAQRITGTVRLKDRVLKAAPLTFTTAGGAVLGSLELDTRPAHAYPLAIEASCRDIDISTVFREFQDFGQEFIGHRHLSGRTQAHVVFKAPLRPDLTLDTQRLLCSINIAVDDGAIKGHAPLIAVADHLKGNKLVAPFVNIPELRKRLSDVRFAKLENRIDIRDGAVHIPAMEVRSTAMDIELSGTHWFDDRIEHHLNFRLGDLFRIGKPARDEFGPIMDDGTGLRVFLRMYGTASQPQFANDGAMAAARRRQQFQQEKQELRDILRQDLGLFRAKDGGPADRPTDKPGTTAPRIDVEWGGQDSTTAGAQGRGTPNAEKGRERKGGLFGGGAKDKEEKPRERIILED
jgi:hypothetical protein